MHHVTMSEPAEPCGLTFAQLQTLHDEQLMQHLRHGHNDALAVLFERYRRLVFSVALKIVRDVAEAEDVTQNVFLEAHRLADQFDASRGTLKVWLLQFAYHRSINHRKRLNRRDFYHTVDLSQLTDEDAVSDVTITAQLERQRLLVEALDRISSSQSKVITLACFEGLTFQEIAERMGESLGNIRHHYYRGILRLRDVVTQKSTKQALGVRREAIDAEA